VALTAGTLSDSMTNFGSWVQVTATTSAELFIRGFTAVTNLGAEASRIQFGVGAAGSEVVVFDATINGSADNYVILGVIVPAGVRLAVRRASSVGGTTTVSITPNIYLNADMTYA
jgi:hypothetical protein